MRAKSLHAIFILVGTLCVGGCQGDKSEPQTGSSSTPPAFTPQADTRTAANQVTRNPSALQQQKEELAEYVPPTRLPQEMTLVSMPVTAVPTIDGYANEPFWSTAPAITTLDFSSQRPITIKSVYTTDEVFFLVTFPESTPAETHKPWIWDPQEEIYREGPDREDVFVFKWSMSGNDVNLALRDPEPHRADIWFWKACRTNPAGYADDKWQSFSREPGEDTRQIVSPKYGTLYFRRVGDVGEAPFEEKFFFEYQGDVLTKYAPRQPMGSRGDIRAKGVWSDGQWSIEFGRKLDTEHNDDVIFVPGGVYLFGMARYAMAYDTPHESWSQPLYRTGDVFDRLLFTMAPRNGQ